MQHQAKYWVVIELTGRPSTKRSQVCCCQAGRRRGPADQQPIAGQGFGIGIVLRDRLLDQSEGLIVLGPRMQAGRGQATPPDLILEPQAPVWMGHRQADQAVARTFFRAYAGSGLVIQRFARFQPIPRRPIACRIVSSLTRSEVRPARS